MGPLGSYVRDNISINQSATRLIYPEVLNIKVVFGKKMRASQCLQSKMFVERPIEKRKHN